MPVERLEITGKSFVYFNLLAIFTGVACGIIAIGFRYLIFGFNDIFFTKSSLLLGAFSPYYIFLIPAVGGLFVGLLTFYLASEAKGHGVPEVMASMALYGGKIRPRVVGVKALASSICIGSGGSAGREGPIVQMGATTGSTIAQKLGFNPYYTKVLVACGAAGGIAGTFNTPIAGALFAPSLFIGAMLGGAFGMLVHQGFPTITASHEAYAIVGMAAVFAGGSGAILTSIIMVFEMTGDYAIILPVMFASVISTLWPNSLWTRPSIPSSSAGGV
ncbi:MAG: chloride channel protein [Archaeoglobaceae archaeon]